MYQLKEGIRLVLASASPRREEILRALKLDFEVLPADIDEEVYDELKADELVVTLAKEKAGLIATRVADSVVIGADTTVEINGHILGKPKGSEEVRSFLETLSGKTHNVHGGVAIYMGGKVHTFLSTTEVTMRQVSDAEIAAYLATDEPYDKAGGYGIQGSAAPFIKSINGSYHNVVGLDVARVVEVLKDIGAIDAPG